MRMIFMLFLTFFIFAYSYNSIQNQLLIEKNEKIKEEERLKEQEELEILQEKEKEEWKIKNSEAYQREHGIFIDYIHASFNGMVIDGDILTSGDPRVEVTVSYNDWVKKEDEKVTDWKFVPNNEIVVEYGVNDYEIEYSNCKGTLTIESEDYKRLEAYAHYTGYPIYNYDGASFMDSYFDIVGKDYRIIRKCVQYGEKLDENTCYDFYLLKEYHVHPDKVDTHDLVLNANEYIELSHLKEKLMDLYSARVSYTVNTHTKEIHLEKCWRSKDVPVKDIKEKHERVSSLMKEGYTKCQKCFSKDSATNFV